MGGPFADLSRPWHVFDAIMVRATASALYWSRTSTTLYLDPPDCDCERPVCAGAAGLRQGLPLQAAAANLCRPLCAC